jgi:AsmA family protein
VRRVYKKCFAQNSQRVFMSSTSWSSEHPVARRLLQVVAAIVALLVVLLIVLSLLSDEIWKHLIEKTVASKTGRQVSIEGPVHVSLWRWAPQITVDGFTLGNASWVPDKPMLSLKHFEANVTWGSILRLNPVFPRIVIDGPDVDLERDQSNRANWDFSSPGAAKPAPAEPSAPLKLPAIQQLIVSSGHLRASDAIRKLKFNGEVSIAERVQNPKESALRVKGAGVLNDKPFQLLVTGGPLLEADSGKPYAFDSKVTAADIKLEAHTEIHKAFDFGSVTSTVHLSGKDLADFYYLTGLALPNTPPYDLTGLVRRENLKFSVDDFKGQLGSSDIHGTISIDAGRARPFLRADLTSSLLKLADLATPLGTQASAGNKGDTLAAPKEGAQIKNPRAKPGKEARKAVGEVDQQATETGFLLPDADLQVTRVRTMDADVKFDAESIQTEKMPIKKVEFHLLLNDGQLKLDPLGFSLPQGEFSGQVSIDARASVPVTNIDMHLKNLDLGQFKAKGSDTPPLEGQMIGRVRLTGRGSSVHKAAATANGDLTIVMPHGRMRAAFAELTGINLDRGLGLLLTKKDDSTEIRCGVASFHADNGDLKANSLLFDTTHVLVTGGGHINLSDEALDVSLQGKPKEIRVVRLRSPIEVKGTLAHPSVGLEPGHLAAQAGAAAALGVVLTPAAAVLAFVDGGLAKDANCSAVVGQGEARTGAR